MQPDRFLFLRRSFKPTLTRLKLDRLVNCPCAYSVEDEGRRHSGSEGEASCELESIACACMLNPYSSVDPALPYPKHINLKMKDIGAILQNENFPSFERYRAMFSLRNRGAAECVMELGKTLGEDLSSALLRHEVAYMLGQMQHPNSVEALAERLRRDNEDGLVRHESTGALGPFNEGGILLRMS